MSQKTELREKTPPQAIDAEQCVIACCLNAQTAIAQASELLESKATMYVPVHQIIFGLILEMAAANEVVDVVTVSQRLHQIGKYTDCGGSAYLTRCIELCPSLAEVQPYAKIVADKAAERALADAAQQTLNDVYLSEKNTEEKISAAGQRFSSIGQSKARGGFQQVGSEVDSIIEEIKARRRDPRDVIGLPTGFLDIDDLTGGQRKGEMTILAARPGMGKSALSMQIALNVATNGAAFNAPHFHGAPVAFVSLEMSRKMLLTRAVAQVARIDAGELARGYIDAEQESRACYAAHQIKKAPLYIDDARGSTTFQLLARTRKLVSECGGVGLIVVDYLQLVKSAGKPENRIQELSEVGKSLRAMAQEFDCHILALAQLSRSVEQRDDKRPILSDLRDSGTIEEDADDVAFIYRDAYYKKNNDPTTEIIFAKARNHSVGTRYLNFFPELVRFDSASK